MKFIKRISYLQMSVVNIVLAVILLISMMGREHFDILMVFGVIIMFHAGYFMSYHMIRFQLWIFPDEFWIKRLYTRFAMLFAYIFILVGIAFFPVLILSAIFDEEGRLFAWAMLASPYSFIYGGNRLRRFLHQELQKGRASAS